MLPIYRGYPVSFNTPFVEDCVHRHGKPGVKCPGHRSDDVCRGRETAYNRGINLILKALTLYHCLNPFPNKPWFLRVCSTGLLKTLREKEKLLVTSNFSFSLSVFSPCR